MHRGGVARNRRNHVSRDDKPERRVYLVYTISRSSSESMAVVAGNFSAINDFSRTVSSRPVYFRDRFLTHRICIARNPARAILVYPYVAIFFLSLYRISSLLFYIYSQNTFRRSIDDMLAVAMFSPVFPSRIEKVT